jgi:predicted transcriptional regulator
VAHETVGSTLGELEARVLEELWKGTPLTTPEVFLQVGQPRGLAYTTILTVLQRLSRKGLVSRSDAGRSHRYVPALSRQEFLSRRGEGLASELVRLGESGIAAFLAEAERLDPKVIDSIRKQLENSE